jgi:hypothetical protein
MDGSRYGDAGEVTRRYGDADGAADATYRYADADQDATQSYGEPNDATSYLGDAYDATDYYGVADETVHRYAPAAIDDDRTMWFAGPDDTIQFTAPVAEIAAAAETAAIVPADRHGTTDVISLRIGKGVTTGRPGRFHRPDRRRRGRAVRFLAGVLTVVLVAAAAWTAWQWWHRLHNRVQVTAVTVTAARPATACDVQFDIVGTIATNGKPGTVAYHWVRSDGQDSGTLTQSVGAGQTGTAVHLYWKFTGQGRLTATATLRVLRPTSAEGTTRITYACP